MRDYRLDERCWLRPQLARERLEDFRAWMSIRRGLGLPMALRNGEADALRRHVERYVAQRDSGISVRAV